MKIYDGHVHSPYCPHGSIDSFHQYVEQALYLGYEGLTFTEHAPLPKLFVDPTPEKDSAMSYEDLPRYIKDLKELKKEYNGKINIQIGLEVDYIEGFEDEAKQLLEDVGQDLDDSILSVHFLKLNQKYYCLDYSLKGFEEIIKVCNQSIDQVYEKYIQTVRASIRNSLGPYKPKRIGHITLPAKYQQVYPIPESAIGAFQSLLQEVKSNGMTLDYNGAGTQKPECLEPYPPKWLAKEAFKQKIPLIYGSDAHAANRLGQGYKEVSEGITLEKAK